MANRYDDDKFGEVVRDYVRGQINRRQFIIRGAQLGLSAAVLAKMTRSSRAANLIELGSRVRPMNRPLRPNAWRSSRPSPTKGPP